MTQTLYGRMVERFKRRLVRLALKKSEGSVPKAAKLLEMHRVDLWALIKRFRINPKFYRPE